MRPINLLPPEQAAKSKARRRYAGLVFVFLAFVALLALATMWLSGQADDAEERLAQQNQANDQLRTQIAALDEARALRSDYEAGAERVATVLSNDIAWGRVLNDLARVIADHVWISNLAVAAEEPTDDSPARGSLTVSGTAFDFPDAATWLRIIDSDLWPAVGGGWVSTVGEGTIGEIPVVNFTSTASLTAGALSDRIDQRIPVVPE